MKIQSFLYFPIQSFEGNSFERHMCAAHVDGSIAIGNKGGTGQYQYLYLSYEESVI